MKRKRIPVRITLEMAQKLSRIKGYLIHTRPEPDLPEIEQYALLLDPKEIPADARAFVAAAS